jgi:hypothetical protein
VLIFKVDKYNDSNYSVLILSLLCLENLPKCPANFFSLWIIKIPKFFVFFLFKRINPPNFVSYVRPEVNPKDRGLALIGVLSRLAEGEGWVGNNLFCDRNCNMKAVPADQGLLSSQLLTTPSSG